MCIVAALVAGEAQSAQLETVRAAAVGRAEQPLHFSWFQAATFGAAAQFAAQLGLDAGQAPALVAVAPRKERAAVMTGRFDKVRAAWVGRAVCRFPSPAEFGTYGNPLYESFPWPSDWTFLVLTDCLPISFHLCGASSSPPSLQGSISEWLDGLLSGKVRTGQLQRLPDFPAAEAAAADAAASPEAPLEEEFDLNEIMNVRMVWGGHGRRQPADQEHGQGCKAADVPDCGADGDSMLLVNTGVVQKQTQAEQLCRLHRRPVF